MLKRGEVEMRPTNGAKCGTIAVGTYILPLSNGLELRLLNCYYVPSFAKNIISISKLCLDDFKFVFEDKSISFSKGDLFHGKGILDSGLYTLDQSYYTNCIQTKKARIKDSKLYLWHCRLSHVNKKHIERLMKDERIKSFEFDLDETCEACIARQDDQEAVHPDG